MKNLHTAFSTGSTRFIPSLAHHLRMGMFDTIHVKTPMLCPGCGAEHLSLQTKEFSNSMSHFKIGSVLSDSPVLMGILKESLWCSPYYKAGRESNSPVYLVIWHSLLAGVEQDAAKAEARLASIDRLDLIRWLDEAQREAARWHQHYNRLHCDVRRWHEHLAHKDEPEPDKTDPDAKRQRAWQRVFGLSEDILSDPDSLAAILKANEHSYERREVSGSDS